ncbi:MAG TPA: hypothetical protein VEK07_19745 [Polyangiaceae bacterium]|nr:hypothetical protein [Polyangiaceae bacterium]
MITSTLGPSADLSPWAIGAACVLGAASFGALLVEMRRGERGRPMIATTGLLATIMVLAAVLRPARISASESVVGARIVVLADESRSMALAADDGRPRSAVRDDVVARLRRGSGREARLQVLGFGVGAPTPLLVAQGNDVTTTRAPHSDLAAALRSLSVSAEERPAAIVVVSDGRLDDPPDGASKTALRGLDEQLRVPIHTVAVAQAAPADASVRGVTASGAAVAHVPLPVRVEVGCSGTLTCDEIPVTARELREDAPPALLASGTAHLRDGRASLDLTITLDRAGTRLVEIAIAAPAGDTIPSNDRRLVVLDVARDRVRVLHVAGRPTNDVRALRQWLKSDASVDVVAFFILRTPTDDVRATQNELALIPFPVDELFTEHLPSFDAVVLQDFDAQPYHLEKYLSNLERYVRSGGGLAMVGGQNSFVAGGYAGTPLAEVLPVELDASRDATGADTSPFVPEWTDEGRAAPLLAPLREVVGDDLPEMAGANVLGEVRPGSVALWTHPTRTTRSGKMPVLAIGDEGAGRAIALGVDGAWALKFSAIGARTAGRAHGALWDGLLGWLMHDPRFEAARMESVGACIANVPSTLRAQLSSRAAGIAGKMMLDVTRIDHPQPPLRIEVAPPAGGSVDLSLPPLEAGAYAARLHVGAANARFDFACEAGGDEWADPRPDVSRLKALASATGGTFASADEAEFLPLPKPTVVSAERRVSPIAPPWAWSGAAAAILGVHWLVRRRGGLS